MIYYPSAGASVSASGSVGVNLNTRNASQSEL